MKPRVLPAAAVALLTLSGALSGCTTNPATGEQTFTGLMTPAEEIRVGRAQHPKIVKEFGGVYGSPALRAYVNAIGGKLARSAERRELKYTFTVLNSDVVNAFALPGGYIYITRGLLALAGDEAELAAVLAHELGHITALHHAQRAGQDLLAGVLVTGLGIAIGRGAAETGGMVAQTVLRGFSREHEYQSDDLGIRYMVRAGYDPLAMADFLRKLRADAQLQARLRNQSPGQVDQFNYLATHPAPVERVRRAEASARDVEVRSPTRGAEAYLGRIDGILYGDDPDQGYVRGRVFSHPRLRFRFEVPQGFRLFNSANSIVALGPGGARIIFDQARRPTDGPVRHYLTRVWARKLRLKGVETIDINGLEAATGSARVSTGRGARDVRLVAVRLGVQKIYRFLFLIPPSRTALLSTGLRRTTYSFRMLDEPEIQALHPLRVRITRVRQGDTVSSLADRMAFEDLRLERFRVLNGLAPNQRLAPGRAAKIVTE